MKNKTYFITGIDTNVGKTLVSAILTEALQADYWKPIQTGNQIDNDTLTVKNLISNSVSTFHSETFSFKEPLSPHVAAQAENTTIDIQQIKLPESNSTLIIEGAGGLMVPLNNTHLIIDLIKQLNAEVILVSKNYLGSINHTLLSIAILQQQKIPIKGIVFNGDTVKSTEEFIVSYTQLPCILRVSNETNISQSTIKKYADLVKF